MNPVVSSSVLRQDVCERISGCGDGYIVAGVKFDSDEFSCVVHAYRSTDSPLSSVETGP